MFTRLIASGLRQATRSVSHIPFSPFGCAKPIKMMHMQTTNLLMKTTMVPSNLHIQNLLELLQKCQKQLQTKSQINSASQLSLLSQGKSVPSSITKIGLLCFFGSNIDTQAGLTKQPVLAA